MATERSQHQQWYDAQRNVLLELGFDLVDIEARLDWILANLPYGEDPATYVFPDAALVQDVSAPELLQDARVAYLADDNVPPRFKLMPSAKAEE